MSDKGVNHKSLLAVLRGALDRRVKQRSRNTVIDNAIEDPAKPLAQRVVEADACDKCKEFGDSLPVDPQKVASEYHQYCKCHVAILFQKVEETAKRMERKIAAKHLGRKEAERVRKEYPEAYREWRDAVEGIGQMKTAQSLYQHVPGTKQFGGLSGTASWFYVDMAQAPAKRVREVRSLIDGKAGSGYPGVKKDGHWDGYEHVYCGRIIGIDRRSETETSSMKIHYGMVSGRVHASPKYDGTGKRLD